MEQAVRFEHLSIEQGLSQSTVRSMIQDSKGFMWFGTDDGLNRYDGYTFKTYKSDANDPYSLIHNLIWSICEDHMGILWIGTHEGLSRFDRNKEKFEKYIPDINNPGSLSQKLVRTIYEDSSNTLWIGTNQGLNQYNRKTDSFIHYNHNPDDPYSLSHDSVRVLFEDSRGNLWIGTYEGLNRFDRKNKRFIRYYHEPDNINSLTHNRIRAVYEDKLQNIWIGTLNGLNSYNPDTQTFTRYKSDPDNPYSISHNSIRSIYTDTKGRIWIGTDGGGLNQWDIEKKQFVHFKHDYLEPSSLSHNRIRAVYEDKSGILWIGTYKGGLNKLNLRTRFLHFRIKHNDPDNFNNNRIRSICEDSFNNLWIGTNEGLNRINRDTREVVKYHQIFQDSARLSKNSVFAIIEDHSGFLWAGTNGSGLFKFDLNNDHYVQYQNDPENSHSLGDDRIRCLYEDTKGRLWIGTYSGGLNQFDRKTGRFIKYPDFFNTQSSSERIIYDIHENNKGILYIATGNGLIAFNIDQRKYKHYQRIPEHPKTLSDNGVLTIHEDSSGILWIGTYNGLNRFDPDSDSKEFIHYKEKQGLPNNVVYGILEDNKGCLWLSTNKGLAKFDIKLNTFTCYDVQHNIQDKEFYPVAYHKTKAGEMIFGGVNGFNTFFPDKIEDNSNSFPVVLTDFKLFGISVPIGRLSDGRSILENSISETSNISLSYKDTVISFEFTVLDYTIPEKNQYSYKMEGFDQDWMFSGSRHFITYTNLPPGQYTFRVKGANSSQIWSNKEASINISIMPPWWKKTWFIILIFFLVTGIITAMYRLRINAVEYRSKSLAVQVDLRTRELTRSNIQLQQEIKERKRVAEALQERERSMKTLVGNLPGLTYRSRNDRHWTKEFVSEGCFQLTGYRPEAFINNNEISFYEIIHEDDREKIWNEVQKALKKRQPFRFIYRINDKNGLEKWVWEQGQGVYENGKIIALEGLIHDITETKEAEKALKQAKTAAEAASRAKSEFLAKMSHEIRTPLNAIVGLTYLAMQTELTVRQRDYLTKIKVSSQILLGVINDILDFSKIEAGKMKLEFTEFTLDEVLETLSHLIKGQAEQKEIEVLFSVDENVPQFLTGDPLRLGQILVNLTGNAVKFTQSGEIIVSVKPADKQDWSSGLIKLLFSVKDTGIGIPPEKISLLFEPFAQADGSTTRQFGGTGLGLSICRRLVEMMGGEINVKSTPGQGSIFSFTAEFGMVYEEEKYWALPSYLEGAKVLLVDDNQSSLKILQAMFLSFSFAPTLSYSGNNAVSILENNTGENSFKLVCLDWKMPGMDGYETLKLIKENPRIKNKPKIIMISGYGETMLENPDNKGVDAILIKPVSRTVLFNTIIEIFDKKNIKKHIHVRQDAIQIFENLSKAKILIVEDNKINQQVARELLESAGITVEIAENGRKAIEAVQNSCFDLILMDVQMPEMDGYEATKAIRNMNSQASKIPVIAMTAHAMARELENCLNAGMDDYVSKPIDPDKMFLVLNKWIDKKILKTDTMTLELPIKSSSHISNDLPGIDKKSGLKRVAGNWKLYKKMLKEFYADYSDTGRSIEKWVKNGDFEKIARLAHTIKGLSGNMGADNLYKAADELELAIRNKEFDEYIEYIDKFEKSLDQVLKSVKCINSPDQAADTLDQCRIIDFQKINNILQNLQKTLKEGDSEALDYAEQLKTAARGTGQIDNINYMAEQINNFDFDDALNTLADIKISINNYDQKRI
ncbi:Two component system response regulator/histidine kinase, PAS domain-containing [Desulfonema limicola]|uniref:Sensory/regulatory protein RpfC n=1 Tax=Desulfonema limicola TaxID=45656 RepID=A0A975GGW6_9BACT|nr:Two component system response regulator/histidine kinase, PAS domain-containing [Desulfonema limicola]